MIRNTHTSRRRILRGMMGGAAVSVGVPLLDCFLNSNGTALASGAQLPVVFGSWFQGLGFPPGLWQPTEVGNKYQMRDFMKILAPYRDKINIYSGMRVFIDGKPQSAHGSGPQGLLQGDIPRGNNPQLPTIDSLVADVIGTTTRFRSIDVSCHGVTGSMSRRGGNVVNPSEPSPLALYTRIFGPGFKDPNAAEFTPDPAVMVKRSVLSSIAESRDDFMKGLGATDRQRMEEYFTSVRSLEKQLDIQLQRPAPLEACAVPAKEMKEAQLGAEFENVTTNHTLFAQLIAHAIACGQTQVFNVMLSESGSNLRFAGSQQTYHMYTHEEAVDPQLGYQPMVHKFSSKVLENFHTLLSTLAAIREGDRTLLDRTLVYWSTDTGFAKQHALENIPMVTAGGANGRIKTGYHLNAIGEPVTRVGLTLQQAMGVSVGRWGTESNTTSKAFSEILA